jgi:two-component system, NarL family, nitrate/nitrite response regulator NarL
MRCLIVDDNAEFLVAAREMLERDGLQVVGVASTTEDALAQAGALRPDVALVDVFLGPECGFELAALLVSERAASPAPVVVLMSTYGHRDLADLIAASGAAGFLSKSELSGRLITAIARGSADRAPWAPRVPSCHNAD